jgi:hypothetical protein
MSFFSNLVRLRQRDEQVTEGVPPQRAGSCPAKQTRNKPPWVCGHYAAPSLQCPIYEQGNKERYAQSKRQEDSGCKQTQGKEVPQRGAEAPSA